MLLICTRKEQLCIELGFLFLFLFEWLTLVIDELLNWNSLNVLLSFLILPPVKPKLAYILKRQWGKKVLDSLRNGNKILYYFVFFFISFLFRGSRQAKIITLPGHLDAEALEFLMSIPLYILPLFKKDFRVFQRDIAVKIHEGNDKDLDIAHSRWNGKRQSYLHGIISMVSYSVYVFCPSSYTKSFPLAFKK